MTSTSMSLERSSVGSSWLWERGTHMAKSEYSTTWQLPKSHFIACTDSLCTSETLSLATNHSRCHPTHLNTQL